MRPLTMIAMLARRPGAMHLLVACGVIMGLVLALGTTSQIIEARRYEVADAAREMKNLSLVLAEETDRAFQSMELVQLGLLEHIREQGIDTPEKFDRELASETVRQDLRHRIVALPHISTLSLISHDGHMVSLSSEWPTPRIDASDRDFFQALSHDPGLTSFISVPVQGRSNGAWRVLFARAVTSPGGQLIGIISTGLELDLFEHLFARIAVSGDPAFTLFRADGVLLARFPRLDATIGREYGTTSEFRGLVASLDREVEIRVNSIDGTQRLIAPHSVAHYPLILSAANTVEAVLREWRVRSFWTSGFVALAELVLAGIVMLSLRRLRDHERLIVADASTIRAESARALAESELALARQREASDREVRAQSQRFDVAMSNMSQGLIMFDGAGRLLVVNQRFIELTGLTAESALSVANQSEMTALVAKSGIITPEDMTPLYAWRRAAVTARVRDTFLWELTDGRVFTVTHQPMRDGWLSTFDDVTESRRATVRMAHMARHDALTDLPNRVLFHEKLEEALAHARRGRPLALFYLDLDQFKAVNDTLGHPVGDGLLQAVALRLTERVRDTDTVARLGGDEFAVIQSPIGQPAEAAGLAERIIAVFDEPFEVAGHQIVIGTSVGIAFAPQDGLDPDDLLKCADLALYRAKLEGRGIYRLFQAEMDARMRIRRTLELDLRDALRNGEMELFYQPLISLGTGLVTGFEALLRWRHPARGLIPPDQFIPLAEEIGAIIPIGEWVLRRACAVAVAWPDGTRVAVNISPVQFRNHNLVAIVIAALADAGLKANQLELEITEAVMLKGTAATAATLHELREIGVHIAMDDFGTGYSSLSYLRQFPFDRIKIDKSFVREVGKQRDCEAIVRAVTGLAHDLGMAVTAEGVETREQLAFLTAAGCTDVQGYLFSPAVPEADIGALLRSMPGIGDMPRPVAVTNRDDTRSRGSPDAPPGRENPTFERERRLAGTETA